jgi:hypoxanthine phosphoribosyltransferase
MEPCGDYIYVADDEGIPPDQLIIPPKYQGYIETILISSSSIKDRVRKLAEDILKQLPTEEIYFLCVLRGAFRFCKDLVEKIEKLNHFSDNIHILEFIRARSYVGDQQEEVVVEGLEGLNLEGKNVVIVEDMVDKGKTLMKVLEAVNQVRPKTVKVCVLVYKRNPENTFIMPDYIGYSLPNKWIVGFNIDFNGHFRDLPHIGVLNDRGKAEFRSR